MLFQSLEIVKSDDGKAPTAAQLQGRQPVHVIFPQIYPMLKQVPEKWIHDSDIIETLCSLFNQCVSTMQE